MVSPNFSLAFHIDHFYFYHTKRDTSLRTRPMASFLWQGKIPNNTLDPKWITRLVWQKCTQRATILPLVLTKPWMTVEMSRDGNLLYVAVWYRDSISTKDSVGRSVTSKLGEAATSAVVGKMNTLLKKVYRQRLYLPCIFGQSTRRRRPASPSPFILVITVSSTVPSQPTAMSDWVHVNFFFFSSSSCFSY